MSTDHLLMLMVISLDVFMHSSMSPWGQVGGGNLHEVRSGGGSLWKLHQLMRNPCARGAVLVLLCILPRLLEVKVCSSCNLCKRRRLGVEDAPPKTLQLDERKFDRKIMSPIIISPPSQLCLKVHMFCSFPWIEILRHTIQRAEKARLNWVSCLQSMVMVLDWVQISIACRLGNIVVAIYS